MLAQFLVDYTMNQPRQRGHQQPRLRRRACAGRLPCAGEDRWLALTVTDDADWQALAVLDYDWAADPRFAEQPRAAAPTTAATSTA
ncbi:MAG: hypothetical protein U0531_09740 [Dehalococcoidia bacterium]